MNWGAVGVAVSELVGAGRKYPGEHLIPGAYQEVALASTLGFVVTSNF